MHIPKKFKLDKPLFQKTYLVDGKLKTWKGFFQDVYSPLSEKDGKRDILIGHYPLLTEQEAEDALSAAVRAYSKGKGEWPAMTIADRIKTIERFTKKMSGKKGAIVKMMVWEIGKTEKDAAAEFDRTIIYIKDTIEALRNLETESKKLVSDKGVTGLVNRSALGVVLCMGPFNYPLNETFTTLIPALIMGNTAIVKPPKHGVLLHSHLLDLFASEFPRGVINTVYGEGQTVISPIISSGKVDCLAFIGSSKVADILKKQCPNPHRLRSILGLEAKNAAIVLPDADIKKAARECLAGSLTFNGQRCTALKIIYVHKAIAKAFVEEYLGLLSDLKIGQPWEEGVSITALAEENKVVKMKSYIEDALANGAKILNPKGGEAEGALMHPVVIYPAKKSMAIYHEEQFGPVVPIAPYQDINKVLKDIGDSRYGQQASIFTENKAKAAELAKVLVHHVCRVNINCQCQRGPDILPFNGRKDSAEGTLSVTDALRAFSIRTVVATKIEDGNFLTDL